MKNFILALVSISIFSCENDSANKAYQEAAMGALDRKIITIDGCEYIETMYHLGQPNSVYSLIHKANCKNHTKESASTHLNVEETQKPKETEAKQDSTLSDWVELSK